MTRDAVINILTKRKDKLGTWAAVAKELKVSPAYLSDCLNNRRDLGKAILDPLGLEAQVEYVRVK